MTDAPSAPPWRILFGVAAGVILLDQVTKFLVRAHLPPGTVYTVIPGCFDLVHGHNTGIVFGLFRSAPTLFTVVNLLILPLLVWGYRRLPLTAAGRVAWAGIVGGNAANLTDRLTLGHVTDFIDWYIGTHHWYAFNVADACISVGVFAIVLLNLFEPPESAEPTADASDPV